MMDHRIISPAMACSTVSFFILLFVFGIIYCNKRIDSIIYYGTVSAPSRPECPIDAELAVDGYEHPEKQLHICHSHSWSMLRQVLGLDYGLCTSIELDDIEVL
jgi:hypothetical protein